jgi:hypothetical protein
MAKTCRLNSSPACVQNGRLSNGEGTEDLPTDLTFKSFKDMCRVVDLYIETQMAPHLEMILIFGTNRYYPPPPQNTHTHAILLLVFSPVSQSKLDSSVPLCIVCDVPFRLFHRPDEKIILVLPVPWHEANARH